MKYDTGDWPLFVTQSPGMIRKELFSIYFVSQTIAIYVIDYVAAHNRGNYFLDESTLSLALCGDFPRFLQVM